MPLPSELPTLSLEDETLSFFRSLKNYSASYRSLGIELITLCRFFVQAHEQSSNLRLSIRLKKVLIAADDALTSAASAMDRTSKVDKKFKKAIRLLSAFEKDFPPKDSTLNSNIDRTVTREAKMGDRSESLSTILHANPTTGNEWPELTRVVKFYLLISLPDAHPIVVKQVLSNNPSLEEVLWNFSRLRDDKKRLTLKENPHFYPLAGLPTSRKGYGDSFKTDPTEDFQHDNKFYVLIDRSELVHIMTDGFSQSFGNLWCPKTSIIFKDIGGRLRGEGIIKASLRGTSCGFCKQLPPASSVPGVSGTRRDVHPIITEGRLWMGWKCSAGCLPTHGSDDNGLGICTGRLNSPLLVPLPPTSEHPEYFVEYRATSIHMLDNDSLFQIFSHYRLKREKNWNLQLKWRKLTHVCRRWRWLIYDLWTHLDMALLLTKNSPSIDTLSHLPPLPLLVDYSNGARTITREDEDNMQRGLRQHGRVRRVTLRASPSSLCMWLKPMDNLFPKLEDLSLSSTTMEMHPMLPKTFRAPGLRRLSLHGVGLPRGLPLLSSAIALSSLSLTHIGASSYFPPVDLITQLCSLPHLEVLSIGFAIPISHPSREGELLPPPIPPVTLPTLRQLTFRGMSDYLDNLVAQVNTPILKQLNLTLFSELDFTFLNLTKFIRRWQRAEVFGCLVARVIFNKDGASVHAGYEQQGIGRISLHVNCDPLNRRIDSATQVCSALGDVVSAVEELTLDHYVDGTPSPWRDLESLNSMRWLELLLPFVGVKKLHIGYSLTLQLSQALESVSEGLVLGLLPGLQELEVPLRTTERAANAFSVFTTTRESVGHPIRLVRT